MSVMQDTLINEAAITGNILSGRSCASRSNLNIVGVPAILFRAALTAVGSTDVVMTYAIRVLAVWAVKTGGAGAGGDTQQVLSTAAAISNAMSTNIADTTIARATSINRTNRNIAAGGILRFTQAGAATAQAIVYVLAVMDQGVTSASRLVAANAIGCANASSGANSNSIGTPVVIYRVPVAAGATADVDTLTTTHAVRVVDAWLVKTVGAGVAVASTIQVQTAAAAAVTDAISINNLADTRLARAAQINDANHEFAAAAVIRIRRVRGGGGGGEDCIVYIMAVRT